MLSGIGWLGRPNVPGHPQPLTTQLVQSIVCWPRVQTPYNPALQSQLE